MLAEPFVKQQLRVSAAPVRSFSIVQIFFFLLLAFPQSPSLWKVYAHANGLRVEDKLCSHS